MRLIIPVFAFVLFPKLLAAQVPTTDIYLMDMGIVKNQYVFFNAEKINDWNGYNNQPYFTPDGKSIYYVSYRNSQADVYRYGIEDKKTSRFTQTPEDEYSPRLTPDGKSISVVRVMKDSSQQLWAFPLQHGAPRRLVNPGDSIGYYCWWGATLVLANVPEPMKMEVRDTSAATSPKGHIPDIRAKNVGRTLVATDIGKSSEILFVQKSADKADSIYWICKMNRKGKIKKLVQTLPNSEDFALGPNKTLYMGHGGRLYKYHIGNDKDWIQIADFSQTAFRNFYRLAVNAKGDKIAIVSYQGKKP